MTERFDKPYWEDHWRRSGEAPPHPLPSNPYLAAETKDLSVGTALDAGCGTGTEALALAAGGWQVTGADISATALCVAARRAEEAHLAGTLELIEVDVSRWEPRREWDLVVTSYAHPDSGQLAFYERIGSWVAPGGTVLVVAHGHGDTHGLAHAHAREHGHPEGTTATLSELTALFRAPAWQLDSAYETTRTVRPGGRPVQLHDVVVRARRTR